MDGRMNRRKFLAALPAALAGAHAMVAQDFLPHFPKRRKIVPQGPLLVYIGTDTSRGVSKGIYQARFDEATGKMTTPMLAAPMVRPTFFALGPQKNGKRVLYSVAAGTDVASSRVGSYSVDTKSGALTMLNLVSSGGVGPCYISVDSTGGSAYVANYGGGTVSSYKIHDDGTLSEPVETLDFHDTARFGENGPNASRQSGPHPHSTMLSPDNRFLLVNDLGHDSIDVFPIDPTTAQMGEMEPHRFTNNHPGSGPRHIAFHPNGRWVYSINEVDSTIDRFLWQTTHHKVGESQAMLVETTTTVKLLADGFPASKNTAAEIQIASNGYFLYASNRGEDTLVVFSINQDSGDLTFVQRISCGGKGPRHFTLTPNQGWIVCGNQDSATLTVFKVDEHTGKLTGPVQTVPLNSPVFTLFV
ncbi:6-phosphogluconolactonase [Granulicella pectinivorans]|uniref:6-phosphogluconolactonase n=2 Tax=Granulicella pectinivorans TaxID=474950 RepID=A0A1I6N169_9BACT|nr:6-phosphogluconolactonase [Granulicella pectinivorans]